MPFGLSTGCFGGTSRVTKAVWVVCFFGLEEWMERELLLSTGLAVSNGCSNLLIACNFALSVFGVVGTGGLL